jgi:TPP-dependent pyruvate/acetoin dehydrogenase alpha subunit
MSVDIKTYSRLYQSMLLIRQVEEYICSVYASDVIKSPVHLSIGQESVAVGICDALNQDDIISNTYRCHATYLAKGGDLDQMMAELYGKAGGCAAGKAGSMHLIDMGNGVFGASAVVGTTIPVAAGYALGLQRDAKKTGKQRIIVSVFGDGATEEGVFSETLNFAALHKLPIIFVCENNGFAIHSPREKRWPSDSFARDRAKAYGISAYYIPDGDVLTIRDTMINVIDGVRNGNGPVFIECLTYRWMEHVGPLDDHNMGYRDIEEYKRWQANDQIAKLENILPAKEVERIKTKVEPLISAAIKFAKESPYPLDEQLYQGVYA